MGILLKVIYFINFSSTSNRLNTIAYIDRQYYTILGARAIGVGRKGSVRAPSFYILYFNFLYYLILSYHCPTIILYCPILSYIILYYPTIILYCPTIILLLCYIVLLSPCHCIILSCHHPTIILYYPIIALLLYYIVLLLSCHCVILSYYCPTIILYCPIIVLYCPTIVVVLLYTFYHLLRL